MSYCILPYQDLEPLCQDETISLPGNYKRYLQPASIDLPIHREVHELSATFIPHGIGGVFQHVFGNKLIKSSHTINEEGFTLQVDHIYLIGLNVSISFPPYLAGEIQTRSSAGRNDLFVSVLQQFRPSEFHKIDPGYNGTLWMIVIPQSYPVTIAPDDCLAQMRIVDRRLSYPGHNIPLKYLSIDLSSDERNFSLYRSYRKTDPDDYSLRFDEKGYSSRVGFWEGICLDDDDSALLHPGHLYIARSCENVQVQKNYAMDLIAYTPGLGEFKSHYAGFFDPGFGLTQPTRAVFEIRVTHSVCINHGQRIARCEYLMLQRETSKPYSGTYQGQGLRLGKQFRE